MNQTEFSYDKPCIHFILNTLQEAKEVEQEFEEIGYAVILFRIKPHKGIGE